MIGIDTNVLLRFLVDDDPVQLRNGAAVAFQPHPGRSGIHQRGGDSRDRLGFNKNATTTPCDIVCDMLRDLLESDAVSIEYGDELGFLLGESQPKKAEIADYLIAWSAGRAGCSHTVTFDREPLARPFDGTSRVSLAPRFVSPEKRGEDAGPDAAAAVARRVHRPGGGARQPESVRRGRQGPRRGARPCALRRPAGTRQDDAGADHGARARRQFPLDLGAGHRQGRRSRGTAHQPRGPRRPLHRRDPPAQSGGRGNPLSGDGGLPARPDHRRGAGGAFGQDRPGQIHAGRRDDAARPADQPAARPFRHPGQAELLFGRGAGADRAARRAHPRPAARRRWRAGDRQARARHAAHRRPAASPRARLRLRRRRRSRVAKGRRRGAAQARGRCARVSTSSTGAISP